VGHGLALLFSTFQSIDHLPLVLFVVTVVVTNGADVHVVNVGVAMFANTDPPAVRPGVALAGRLLKKGGPEAGSVLDGVVTVVVEAVQLIVTAKLPFSGVNVALVPATSLAVKALLAGVTSVASAGPALSAATANAQTASTAIRTLRVGPRMRLPPMILAA
jgi:hypothetical protein